MNRPFFTILYYNKLNLTKRCIQSVIDAGYSAERILCFDNGSQAEISEEVKILFSECIHAGISENRGYTGGFNSSLRESFKYSDKYSFFLTNDTELTCGAWEGALFSAEKHNAGIVAPCIRFLSDSTSIDSAGGSFNKHDCTLSHYREQGLDELLNPETDYVPGTAMLISEETFSELKGVDELYFTFWEDVDLSFRAHARGIKLVRSYQSNVLHGAGKTCRKKPLYTTYYFLRNRVRFVRSFLKEGELVKALDLISREYNLLLKKYRDASDFRRAQYMSEIISML